MREWKEKQEKLARGEMPGETEEQTEVPTLFEREVKLLIVI